MAAQIPDAQLVVISHVGHATLESDSSHCANHALAAFLRSKPLPNCISASAPAVEKPTLVAPARLAALPPAPGLRGRGGRRGRAGPTVTAVDDTLAAVAQEIVPFTPGSGGLIAAHRAPRKPTLAVAGLRGGWFGLTLTGRRQHPLGVRLHRYSFIPGLKLTGPLRNRGHERVGGTAAAGGVLRFQDGRLTGRLAGVQVAIAIPGGLRTVRTRPVGANNSARGRGRRRPSHTLRRS